jgi:minor extracellular serine protease Vpr
MKTRIFAISVFLFSTTIAAGAPAGGNRYALILSRPAAAQQFSSLQSLRVALPGYRDSLRRDQAVLRRELQARNFRVTGAVQTLLNAVFVEAPPARLAELRALPGVRAVAPLHRYRRRADTVSQLQNLPAAWIALGGAGNAGAGIKIAIIDSGIDQTRPSFQDPSLMPPAGFPKCTDGVPADCAFTNGKVIVARSYVSMLAAGTPPDVAATSRPDDLSPRDRVGHGTGLAGIAAGVPLNAPAGPITGMAPKAFLGNYKVFGSPGVNDFTTGDVVIQALDDAVSDGMDIAVLSLGMPAMSGPFDTGAICGQPAGTPCDVEAQAIENAVRGPGIVVAVASGNGGDSGTDANGNSILTPNTIETPAITPSAVSAGASTNSQTFVGRVSVTASGAPSNLAVIPAAFGDGPAPAVAIQAPLADVAKIDGAGLACSPLPAGSLNGALALVLRGSCSFVTKVMNAQMAGALGVVIISTSDTLVVPGGLSITNIPAALIANTEGTALQTYLASHPGLEASLDPQFTPIAVNPYNTVADFSSRGPSITYLAKPDVMGVGTDVYMPTQTFDPNGVMYDSSGYTAASGSSFSAPMAAGIAALVKQQNPNLRGVQIKSAVVTTATQDITDNGAQASVTAAGGGKLNAGSAINVLVTVDPSSISFGAIGGKNESLPLSEQLTVHYSGSTAATLTVSVGTANGPLTPKPDRTVLTFQPGGPDQTVTLTLSGSTPSPGSYEGAILLTGAGAAVRVPYFYVVGDGVPYAAVPLSGIGFDNLPGASVDGGLAFKVVDRYGVAVQGLPVQFQTNFGGGSVRNAATVTNVYGIATADATAGNTPGPQEFVATAGPFYIPFDGYARMQPVIAPGGVVNAASGQAGAGIAPGSYITIYGAGLADFTGQTSTATLPMSINYTMVSFDVPSANLSLPGHLMYVDPGQINLQAPWGLAGQTSVQMKVTIQDTPGAVYTVPVVTYSPAVYLVNGAAAALDENNRLISSSNSAQRGHWIQIYMTGLGPVTNQPAPGAPAGAEPLSWTVATPTVTIGGKTATVLFSGLTPGFPGLNQVNVVVPQDAPAGAQPLIVTIGGVSSPPVNLAVR